MLQDEINLISLKKKEENTMKQDKMRGSANGSVVSRAPATNTIRNSRSSKLNMTVDDEDHMPPIERATSRLSNGIVNKRSLVIDNRFLKSSKEKLFSLETEEDKQIMEDIDQLETEQLRINLLQMVKKNNRLENNLEAVKKEMSSKIAHLRRDNDQTEKFTDSKRPDSTLSRQSHKSIKAKEDPNPYYQQKLAEMSKDNEDAYQRITILENELQNQEKFFKTKLKQQYDQNNKTQEDALMHDSKFINLMDKLSLEQGKFYADK